jgi:prolyl-tRNA synthetase
MGVIAEHFSDEKGLVWPEAIAPALVYLVQIGDSAEVKKQADELYNELEKQNISVLYDDRDLRPGEKLADSELIGVPHRVVVSERLIGENKYEYTARNRGDKKLLTRQELFDKLVIRRF